MLRFIKRETRLGLPRNLDRFHRSMLADIEPRGIRSWASHEHRLSHPARKHRKVGRSVPSGQLQTAFPTQFAKSRRAPGPSDPVTATRSERNEMRARPEQTATRFAIEQEDVEDRARMEAARQERLQRHTTRPDHSGRERVFDPRYDARASLGARAAMLGVSGLPLVPTHDVVRPVVQNARSGSGSSGSSGPAAGIRSAMQVGRCFDAKVPTPGGVSDWLPVSDCEDEARDPAPSPEVQVKVKRSGPRAAMAREEVYGRRRVKPIFLAADGLGTLDRVG